MSFELNILVVDQNEPTKFNTNYSIDVLNENDHPDLAGRFFRIWPIMCKTKGIWYSLGTEYKNSFNSIEFCSTKYDISPNNLPIPLWITDEVVKESLTPLLIKDEFKKELKEIIELLIKESPIGTIMVLARYEGPDYEVIQGVYEIKRFWELLDEGKILFNTCHIVRDEKIYTTDYESIE